MNNLLCPKCEKGRLRDETLVNFETRLRGIPVTIPEAHIRRCDSCGEMVFPMKEMRRWEGLQLTALRSANALPDSNQVKQIRDDLGLNVSQFADLVGITRQTAHAWERPNGGPGLSPAGLLLQLIAREQAGSYVRVIAALQELATARGQPIGLKQGAPGADAPILGKDILPINHSRSRQTGAPTFAAPMAIRV